MRVGVVHGPRDLRLDEAPRYTCGTDDVVVKVAAAGICGTDLHFREMGPRFDRPMALGHELAGEIVEIGSSVRSFRVGERVAYNSYNSPADIGRGGECGGFSSHVVLRGVDRHEQSLCRVPDALDLQYAALVEPISVGAHAVNRAAVAPDESVTVFGVGPIGLGAVMALRWRGVEDIAVFDLSRVRRERALSLGAASAWDPRERPPGEALGDLRGYGQLWGKRYPKTDVYIEASGAPGLLPQIAELCNKQSRIVTLAIQRQPVTFDGTKLMSKEISVIGSSGYAGEFPEVMAKLASGTVDLELLISHRFPFSSFFEAFETASDPNLAAKVLLELDS